MAWQKFEHETAKKPEVRVNGASIILSSDGWSKAGLSGATVNLFWDNERSLLGIKASSADDKSAFKVRESRNGHTINARRFFDRFKLVGLNVNTGAKIGSEDGLVTIPVSVPRRASAPSMNGTDAPRRRGRRPKNAPAQQ